MECTRYIMESEDEIQRLELKTRGSIIEAQARWAGLKPGDRVADIGCGPGKTTARLHKIVQPSGEAIGIDASTDRIEHANRRYGMENLDFVCRDAMEPMDDIGRFDFVWVRFVLEYYRKNSLDLIGNLTRMLNPGGIMCLIDIDQNCMCHYGLPKRLERTITNIMDLLEEKKNFDRNAGRKLYSYLYDLGFCDIDVQLSAGHLTYGEISDVDDFNFRSKVQVAARQSGYHFEKDYPGGFDQFSEEFDREFRNERRFAYTPLICCRGRRHPDS